MTFEQVNDHVEAHDTAAAISSNKLESIYKIARPILSIVASFPLIPQKWRAVVQGLISVLDTLTAN